MQRLVSHVLAELGGPCRRADDPCRTRAQVEYDFFGELRRAELKPGGASIPVTAENRAEFVSLMVDYYLNASVAPQFAAFSAGFHEASSCPRSTL